jgi:hypothetical protein
MTTNQNTINDSAKRLVLARLETMPSNMGIAIGDEAFSKVELKNHVEQEDAVGQKYVEMQLTFLRSLKDGSLFQ